MHKDVFPPTVVPRKVQLVLPQIVVCRALCLDVDKVGSVCAWMSHGSHVHCEETVIQDVICELAEQRWAELSSML